MGTKKIIDLTLIDEVSDGDSVPVHNGIQAYRMTVEQLRQLILGGIDPDDDAVINILQGGTGGTTAADARSNLGFTGAGSTVPTALIEDLAVTKAKQAALGEHLSTANTSQTVSSASYVDVTNLSVSITTSGRPVLLFLQPSNSGGSGAIQVNNTAGDTNITIAFLRGTTVIAPFNIQCDTWFYLPPSAFQFLDVVAAGTYTYKVQAKVGTQSVSFLHMKLVAVEL